MSSIENSSLITIYRVYLECVKIYEFCVKRLYVLHYIPKLVLTSVMYVININNATKLNRCTCYLRGHMILR